MKKIPTIYVRDWDGELGPRARYITRTPNPFCEWVFAGEGVATRKLDGTCCLVKGGHLFRRHEVKIDKRTGNLRETPAGFVEVEVDLETGSKVGWVECLPANPADQHHWAAFEALVTDHEGEPPDGTYELIGPSINANPEGHEMNELIPHNEGGLVLPGKPPTGYDELAAYLREWAERTNMEGIVWHHPDGRMAKIKNRDFPRP